MGLWDSPCNKTSKIKRHKSLGYALRYWWWSNQYFTESLCSYSYLHQDTDTERNCQSFDLLGYFSPVFINAKLLFRDLWKNNLDWDVIISPEQIDHCKNIQKDVPLIRNVKLWRFTGNDQCQLLHFSNASEKVLGTTFFK